jgi:GntR family transcriptional regulator
VIDLENESLKLPLGQKVKSEIIDYILSTGMNKNDMLPSEKELSELLDVSVEIIRESLAILEHDKIVIREIGKAAILRRVPSTIESGLEKLESVTEMIRKNGFEPKTICVGIEEHFPNAEIAKALKIKCGEPVVTFRRIRSANGEFAAFCLDTIPRKMMKFIPVKIEEGSLMKFLGHEMDITLETASTVISTEMPPLEILGHFDIDVQKPLILLEQIHYNAEDMPVLYSRDYFNPQLIKFKINRTR